MADSELARWLQRLERLHPTEMELGLERVGQVARTLGLLPVVPPVITIAGTNGKGTTAAALECLLLAAGRRPGVYTSPHLLHYNERIRIAAQEAPDADIVAAFEVIEAARGETSLTYFEFATLAALWLFRRHDCDVIVLEVGLGGRLDAVNIVDPTVAVITSIGLDHQQWLGSDIDTIAGEKAGILRSGRWAVIAVAAPPRGLMEAVTQSGASALYLGRDFSCEERGEQWVPHLALDGEQPLALPPLVRGALIPSNLCAALQAVSLLGVDVRRLDVSGLLTRLAPADRRQSLNSAGIEYVLDVAHNPQAADKLLEYLNSMPCKKRTFSLFSAMSDKDIPAMIQRFGGVFSGWFVGAQPDNARAASAAQIEQVLQRAGEPVLGVGANLAQALALAQEVLRRGDRLVVFGSFFTVAAVLPSLAGAGEEGVR